MMYRDLNATLNIWEKFRLQIIGAGLHMGPPATCALLLTIIYCASTIYS